ncbi:MAG: PrsW family glutamic-type intramembrane protease, partial [Patescibacteria group bacterium]
YFTVLRTKYFNEPIDAMIYVIAASLGFAALENALFISQSTTVTLTQTMTISSFRFANAILIHASTGAIIGAAFAFSFCNRARRAVELMIALIGATILHAAYNYFILGSGDAANATNQFIATIIVVIGAIFALILFERARRLRIKCL